jgi:hypothetical protein
MSLKSRLQHGWNAFFPEKEPERYIRPAGYQPGMTSMTRPDRPRFRINSERTIIASIYTRMAIDVAGVRMEHVRVDDAGQYVETIHSGLNNCLNVEANLDQAARHFRQDIALTLFGSGVAAIVPVDTTLDPTASGSWDIQTMRVGEILQWWPEDVLVRLYNEKTGMYEDLFLPKKVVAIIENPFYSVMNEPNSTLQRLVHKLSLLDNVDEISSQGKLDIIIQLPYVVKSDLRKNQAEARTKAIQDQLQNSTYGIAYTDGTEKITQLNRSVENNLLAQVQYLKEQLYNELGLTEDIMNGTADDVTMMNYINRTIEPIMDAITEGQARKFLTKTARTQGQTIQYFQTPFKLMPISQLADLIDVLSRNQIITPNEIRPSLGLKPSKEPQADTLVNSNMPLKDQVTGNPLALAAPAEVDEEEAELDKQMTELGLA